MSEHTKETITLDHDLVQSIAALSGRALQKDLAPVELLFDEGGATVPLMRDAEGVREIPGSWLKTPNEKTSVHELATIESFNRLVNVHKNEATRIYGSMGRNRFVAFIDDDNGNGGPARRREHTIELLLKPSESYVGWASVIGKELSQEMLAEFLEARQMDVIEPDSATIIEAVEALELTRDFAFERKVNRESGSIRFHYQDDVKQSGSTLKLPSVIWAEFIPYAGAGSVRIEARLRYRLAGSNVIFRLVVHNWDQLTQEIFAVAASAITKGTELEPYIQH